jgi:hypothetical protein
MYEQRTVGVAEAVIIQKPTSWLVGVVRLAPLEALHAILRAR